MNSISDLLRIPSVINPTEVIAYTFWTSLRYHETAYSYNVWTIVILIEHRYIFGGLISTELLEMYDISLTLGLEFDGASHKTPLERQNLQMVIFIKKSTAPALFPIAPNLTLI